MKRRVRCVCYGVLGPALGAAAVWLAACSVNPATGKRQLVLVSESQERRLGMESDRSMVEELGLYVDSRLQGYVAELGRRLAAGSERPGLDWTFRVVDDPVVNAFALPGGYVYVTRGILAHFDSEAELAAVLGHEIGHVTARHGVEQVSRARLAEVGLGLGAILAPEEAKAYGGLAQSGLGLLFLKYSRDDERQADELGLRYLSRGGYDPRPMTEVFEMLERVGRQAGGERLPVWLSTHPAPEDRREWAERAVASLPRGGSGSVNREVYLERLEGLVFGDDPRAGFFRENLFLHPQLRFQLRFPGGWKLENRRRVVAGAPSGGDAALALSTAPETSARAALQGFLSRRRVACGEGPAPSIRGLASAGCPFAATSNGGSVRGLAVFVEYGGKVYGLLGQSSSDRWKVYRRAIEEAIRSFAPLTDAEALAVAPRRLKLVRPPQSMDLEAFASRYEASVPAETLARINRLEPGSRLRAGQLYKVVTGGPPRSAG